MGILLDVWLPLEWSKAYLENYVKTYNQNMDYKQVIECQCSKKWPSLYIYLQEDPTFQFVPPQIANDERYMPYFKVYSKIQIMFFF
jgi:hypothetical protein